MTIGPRVFLSIAVLFVSACSALPQSVRDYASTLPGRADGQYAPLDGAVKKQLVTMDALLQCKIDLNDDKKESDSAACRCVTSSSESWIEDCRGWLKDHTPAQARR